MIAALEAAICGTLGALPGVATCRPYAGELEDSAGATLRVPALLVLLTRARVLPDHGTGELHLNLFWSVFVCVRHAAASDVRGQSAWALAERALMAVRANSWGLAGVEPALLREATLETEQAELRPLWELEPKGLAVREVRWTQSVRLGESEWDGGALPSEVWLGIAPRIGEMGGTAEDYWRVDRPPPRPTQ